MPDPGAPRPADPPDACAEEPIRVPGAIQPHGWLVALREPDLEVVAASANIGSLFGAGPEELAGRPLAATPAAGLAEALAPLLSAGLEDATPAELDAGGGRHDLVAHRSGGLLLAEIEPAGDPSGERGAGGWPNRLRRALQRLPLAGSVIAMAEETASEVAALTGFDRVMIYRFTPEWDGEVIAETRRGDLEPFLGLRYPASDIPAQARDLYTTNWLRLIPASSYQPVPIVPGAAPDGSPIDLSGSMLRSVSPVHLEYLRNMGVAASMSVSLVSGGKLWGLIACHHYSGPHRPPYPVRTAAELLGRSMSLLVAQREQADGAEQRARRAADRSHLTARLALERGDPADILAVDELRSLLAADGATVRLGAQAVSTGDAPDARQADAIAAALLEQAPDKEIGATDRLSVLDPRWAALAPGIAGALAVRVGDSADRYVLWTRAEWQREVTWAGDPRHAKEARVEGGEVRLSPRRSFEAWVERVGSRARRWEDADREEAAEFGRELSDLLLRRVFERDELATVLQRTLLAEELPDIPGWERAVRYVPGGDQPVGGDWYDLLALPGGGVAAAIGDVAGHGLMVAAVTAQLRQGLRAYLLRERDAASSLSRLNALAAWVLPDDIATGLVVTVHPESGRMSWCSAGHLPPLVVGDGGARFLEGSRGPALGVAADTVFSAEAGSLGPGETLVLYSDGLVERRQEPIDTGLERLRATAESLPGGPEALCDGLLDGLGSGGRPDDVTLLAIRRAGV